MRVIDFINLLSKHLGYVYVIAYTNRGVGFKEDLIKIGVTDHPKKRFATIQRDLPGRCELLFVFPTISPYVIESNLLKHHKSYLQKPRGAGRGAGAHEFRRLPMLEYYRSLLILSLASLRFYMFVYIPVALLLTGVYKLLEAFL